MTYVYDEKYAFHYIVEGQLTFLCMADAGKRRWVFEKNVQGRELGCAAACKAM